MKQIFLLTIVLSLLCILKAQIIPQTFWVINEADPTEDSLVKWKAGYWRIRHITTNGADYHQSISPFYRVGVSHFDNISGWTNHDFE